MTIGGNFVTGVEAVKFGGVSVPFDADISDGTVTATAPAHSAGIVDVTVTTPGGTSQKRRGRIPTTSNPLLHLRHRRSPHHRRARRTAIGWWAPTGGSSPSVRPSSTVRPVPSISSVRSSASCPPRTRAGYWLDASDGGDLRLWRRRLLRLHPRSGLPSGRFGRAELSSNAPIVGMVPSSDGGGYFMVASDGGVFAFGDARFAGSCPGIGGCSGAAVAVMPDASGNGYWLVTQTGHVYTFGDAPNYGAPDHRAFRSRRRFGLLMAWATGSSSPMGPSQTTATQALSEVPPASSADSTRRRRSSRHRMERGTGWLPPMDRSTTMAMPRTTGRWPEPTSMAP